MKSELAAIKKALKLLQPIEHEPCHVGWFLRVDGNDAGGIFCKKCIKEQPAIERQKRKEKRKEILGDFAELEKTGKWHGKKPKEKYTAARIAKAKRSRLKEYPAKIKIEVKSCDPDFSGCLTYPESCSTCGEYFYSDFEPDLESARSARGARSGHWRGAKRRRQMFSNGTDAMLWQSRNCFKCWKHRPEAEYGKARCKAEEEISLGYISGELSKRVEKITENAECKYRQEKRPARKAVNARSLFNNGGLL